MGVWDSEHKGGPSVVPGDPSPGTRPLVLVVDTLPCSYELNGSLHRSPFHNRRDKYYHPFVYDPYSQTSSGTIPIPVTGQGERHLHDTTPQGVVIPVCKVLRRPEGYRQMKGAASLFRSSSFLRLKKRGPFKWPWPALLPTAIPWIRGDNPKRQRAIEDIKPCDVRHPTSGRKLLDKGELRRMVADRRRKRRGKRRKARKPDWGLRYPWDDLVNQYNA